MIQKGFLNNFNAVACLHIYTYQIGFEWLGMSR